MSRFVIAYRYYVHIDTPDLYGQRASPIRNPSPMPLFQPYQPDVHGVMAENIDVRRARPADAPAIAHIDAQRSGTNAADILPLVHGELEAIAAGENPKVVFVACQGEQVLAFAKCVEFGSQFRGVDHDLPQGWYLSGVTV
jgi:hypothetical protein